MKILLASRSPRRKLLLQKMGLHFESIESGFDEFFDNKRSVHEVAKELAYEKANAVAELHPDAVVIGGDTLVGFHGKQLGKPKYESEARRVLQGYKNSSCEVVSSVAVICKRQNYSKTDADTATVYFKDFNDQLIDQYLATGDYKDKGGSFAIQHPIARKLIARIEGRPDTTIALPTHHLGAMLTEVGIPTHVIDLQDKTLLQALNAVSHSS